MTCPCKDMKILQRQHDFDGLLKESWTAQSLHGLWISQGIQVQGVWVHPRPFPAHTSHIPGWAPALPAPLPAPLAASLAAPLAVCGAVLPPPFRAEIPTPASHTNPAVPWCFFSLDQTQLWCLFCACAFIGTARAEEPDRRNALSRIPRRHSLFLPPCALVGFHHKAAAPRLSMGLRLIYCPVLSREPPEATSAPCEDKMPILGPVWRLMFSVLSRSGQHFPKSSPALASFLQTCQQRYRFCRVPWRKLGLASGMWLQMHKLLDSLIR